jgi:hypothetical protein
VGLEGENCIASIVTQNLWPTSLTLYLELVPCKCKPTECDAEVETTPLAQSMNGQDQHCKAIAMSHSLFPQAFGECAESIVLNMDLE